MLLASLVFKLVRLPTQEQATIATQRIVLQPRAFDLPGIDQLNGGAVTSAPRWQFEAETARPSTETEVVCHSQSINKKVAPALPNILLVGMALGRH